MFGSNDDKKAPAAAGEKKSLFGWLRKKPQEPVVEQPQPLPEPTPAPVIDEELAPIVLPIAEPVLQPVVEPDLVAEVVAHASADTDCRTLVDAAGGRRASGTR